MTKTTAPSLSSKDINIYIIPSIGTAKETCLFLEPGGVTQYPIHSDKSSISSGPSVSGREIEWEMKEIYSIETMDNIVDNTVTQMIEMM